MDHSLIERLRKQDPDSQEHFYRKYAEIMFRLCFRYLGNEHDTSEVLNDGFYKAFTQMNLFKQGDLNGLLAWVRKIMVNECLMFLRKKKRLQFNMEDEPGINEIPVFQYIETDAELYFTLISQMDDKYRLVFSMYVLDGYTHQEISRLLKIPENTSRSYLLRARIDLQKKIKKIQTHDTTRK